jgi:hypothetical protein
MKIARLLLILLGLLLLLAVATPLVGAYMLRRYVDKDFLVQETEKNINARVHIDDVTLTLFTWPPSLRLSGIKIAPRDQYAGTPIAARSPLKQAPVQVEMAYVELVPEGLFHRHFFPRVLRLIKVDVNESIGPQGSSLEVLFQPPPEKLALMQQEEVPRAIPLPAPPTVAVDPGSPPPSIAAPLLDVQEEPKHARAERLAIQEISIEQAHFRITNQDAESKFDADISDFSLALTEIDIDPDNLMAHNRLHVRLAAKIVVDGMAKVGGQMRQVQFANMTLHGEGEVNPVDPATLAWSPAADLDLVIDRGSSIGGNVTIGEAAGSNLDKLMKYGIDISDIRSGGTLPQDVAAAVHYRDQAIRFRSDTQFALPEYEYTIKRESWIDFAKDQQVLLTRLSCGEALKQSVVNGISSRGLGQTVSKLIVEGLSDNRGRLSFDLTVTGSLSHPEVKPDIQIKLESLLGGDIEEKAKGLIDTFKGLKGLFKKD